MIYILLNYPIPTLESVSNYNPVVTIQNSNISLGVNYIDDDDNEIELHYENIAILEHNQIVIFLYNLILTDYFSYGSRYGFNKYNIKEYKKKLKLPFHRCKK